MRANHKLLICIENESVLQCPSVRSGVRIRAGTVSRRRISPCCDSTDHPRSILPYPASDACGPTRVASGSGRIVTRCICSDVMPCAVATSAGSRGEVALVSFRYRDFSVGLHGKQTLLFLSFNPVEAQQARATCSSQQPHGGSTPLILARSSRLEAAPTPDSGCPFFDAQNPLRAPVPCGLVCRGIATVSIVGCVVRLLGVS